MEPYPNLTYNEFMDMKKKLEDAYKTDKPARKEKVLIGLSGGLDSFVTAYLLKIQKYDLVAATVVNQWEGQETNALLACQIDQNKLNVIHEFCHRLNIPHYVIKAQGEFREQVIEKWVSSRLSGKLPQQCWDCHELRMNLLYEKMKDVGAQQLATGHFAKLFQQDAGSVFVHTSNDEVNDQSALLSRLPHSILKSMLLPLSDLTQKEVLKLAENFGVKEEQKIVNIHECLPWKEEMRGVFEKMVPARFLKGGDITSSEGDMIKNHEGVFEHGYGESFDLRASGKMMKVQMGSYTPADRHITAYETSYFNRNKIHLVNCHYSEGTTWPEPIKGFIVISSGESIECWIHPKSMTSAFIELSSAAAFSEGEILSVIKKKGKNAKVYLTGKVQFLPLDPITEEGEPRVPEVDRSRDY